MSKLLRSPFLLLLLSMFLLDTGARGQINVRSPEAIRDLEHSDPQWMAVQEHLPDPATATADKLELAADVLRARRYPADALDYYQYALRRGGPEARLMNKLGVTELELRSIVAARIYFERVIHLNKKDAQGWNNLGAVEYLNGRYGRAASNYSRAIKLDKKSATFHSNLGTAYFEEKDFASARKQYEIALRLDPQMAEHAGTSGVAAHMLSPQDRARYCFEMARLYAERGDEANLLRYLTMASEGGFDVLSEMGGDSVMGRYRKDPRVLLLVRNAQALRAGRDAVAYAKGGVPPLPAAPQ